MLMETQCKNSIVQKKYCLSKQRKWSCMPAILSHHLFGRAFLAREDNQAFMTRETRDAFLLGNQGPDPLFYATLTPSLVGIKKLGSRMHREHIEKYLSAWQKMLEYSPKKNRRYEIMQAYLYGFLCHYVLDRTTHPLICAYQEAICHAGIIGLDSKDYSFVHAQIEADLDVYLLHRLTGKTLKEYQIPKQVLYSSNAALANIDVFYQVAARINKMRVPHAAFSRSVKDMRTAVSLMYSPGGTKRELIGRVERLARPHSLLQAMSHCPEAYVDTWYANERREPWLHPDTQRQSCQSFIELFEEALDNAACALELLCTGVPKGDITRGLDFFGNKVSASETH